MTDEELVDLYKSYRGIYYLKNCKSDSELQKFNLSEEEAYRNFNILWQHFYGDKLDPDDEDDKNTLFEFANKTCKYTLLNDALKEAYLDYAYLEKDMYVLNNFDKIIDIVQHEYEDTKAFELVEEPKLPYLNPDDLEMYLIDFLDEVDKSGEYLDVFYDLKKNGNLFYLDSMNDEQKERVLGVLNLANKKGRNFFWRDERLGRFVFIERENTIDDFRKLVHEFIHYATSFRNDGNRPSAILLEFPPIFYELLACNFLLSKGYSSEDIQNLAMLRLLHISSEASTISYINPYLRLFLNQDEPISISDDIQLRKDQILAYKEQSETFTCDDEVEAFETADEISDLANSLLTANPKMFRQSYPYIVGYNLAKKYIKKASTNKESILNGMKYITFHLPSLNTELIFKDEKDKVKTKKMI